MNKKAEDSAIPVGYYLDFTDETVSKDLILSLTEVSGRLNFINYSDVDTMINDTAGAKLECSYIFTEGIIDNITNGKIRDIVIAYKSPQSVVNDMIDELVFAAVFRVAGDDILYHYAKENDHVYSSIVETKEMLDRLSLEFDNQFKYGNTFSIDFKVFDENSLSLDESQSIETLGKPLPIHGIIGIFLFLCLLLSCNDYISEKEKGTLCKLSFIKKIRISSCIMHSWLLPAVISSLISIILLNGFMNITTELISILIYYILLIMFGIFLNIVINKGIIMTALIPLLIIGCLIFTPIILDISQFVPVAGFVEKLFLPYYYISLF
ncbi:MAG: hypothetical protein IJW18_00480 [Lachnospiraceae bacterium]|nr:hypothetical protein [Lachnospiraceae bacterium]